MRNVPLLLAAFALAGTAANAWSVRKVKSIAQAAAAEVQTQPLPMSESEILDALWKSGEGIPRPMAAPKALPSVDRIRWTRSAIETWGVSPDQCAVNQGKWNRGECVWRIASTSTLAKGAQGGAGPLEETKRTLRLRVEQGGGELTIEDRVDGKGNLLPEVRLDLTVPTVEGLGKLLSGLSRLPFVLNRLDWDESGATTITGALVGK